ncbi:glycoside hydrolase domain-containing protein [Nocardioides sp.]|uniref:glycoside hydrolase domain-containing protein n=1 Tax=Nocardioides sp. TaxID=35761 RepID=UPI002ED245C4
MFRAIPLTLAWLLAAAVLTVPVRADAGNVATPGNFKGHGFDQCVAPTQKAMNAWLRSSPFLAVGIYISGDSRGCRTQPNLSQKWVATQLRKGWRLLPITLGPQASCHPSFPRYGNDPTINPRPGQAGTYRKARRQARREATKAVAAAQALGIVKRSTLWYDLEGFDVTNRRCRESAIAFLSAWTTRIRALGYVSGVYSSAGSGIKMLDDARVNRPDKVVLPDRIWIARWDGLANTRTDYIRDDGWLPGGRMKQYRGGHNETWGGVTINIDSNWLNLGKGMFARPVSHCDGVDVDHPAYLPLAAGTSETALVKALQCLLKEKGRYGGRLHGRYTAKTAAAARQWQTDHGFAARDTWTRTHWMSLLADGPARVLKFGSAGEDVRRVQRALKAAGASAKLKITGRYTKRTTNAVKSWQASVGQTANGIVVGRTWRALRAGRR